MYPPDDTKKLSPKFINYDVIIYDVTSYDVIRPYSELFLIKMDIIAVRVIARNPDADMFTYLTPTKTTENSHDKV